MQTWTVIKRAMDQILVMRTEKPIFFWIIVILNLLVALGLIIYRTSSVNWKTLGVVRSVSYLLTFLVKLMTVPIISVFITFLQFVEVDVADLFNNHFFVEIIVVAFITSIIKGINLWIICHKNNETIDDDIQSEFDESMSDILKSVVLIILSLLFILTNLEDAIINWGRIGRIVFGAYTAWSVSAVLGLLTSIGVIIMTVLSIIDYVIGGHTDN